MNNELCFKVENKELYLAQVLVEFDKVPIFFLCRSKEEYYLVLCTDIEEYHYVIVKLSVGDVYGLLHGKIAMRDTILKQDVFWKVCSGDDIESDIVTKMNIDLMDYSVLPEQGACFTIFTEAIKGFVRAFDDEYFANNNFVEHVNIDDLNVDYGYCEDMRSIKQFIDVSNCVSSCVMLNEGSSNIINYNVVCENDIIVSELAVVKSMVAKEHFELSANVVAGFAVAA